MFYLFKSKKAVAPFSCSTLTPYSTLLVVLMVTISPSLISSVSHIVGSNICLYIILLFLEVYIHCHK